MKLADAIRKGAEKTEKCHGHLFEYFAGQNPYKSCTLGAAIIGMGEFGKYRNSTLYAVRSLHPVLAVNIFNLPEKLRSHGDIKAVINSIYNSNKERVATLHEVIWILNDRMEWSRKAIAEWIETIEDYLETQDEDVIIRPVENTIGQETPAY